MPEFTCQRKLVLKLPQPVYIYRAQYPVDEGDIGFYTGRKRWKIRKIAKSTGVKIIRPTSGNACFTIIGVTYSAVESAWIMFFEERLNLIRIKSKDKEEFDEDVDMDYTITILVDCDEDKIESLAEKIRTDFLVGVFYNEVEEDWDRQLSKLRRRILGDYKPKPFYWLSITGVVYSPKTTAILMTFVEARETFNKVINHLLNTPFTETIQSTWKASSTPTWCFSPDEECSFSELRQKYKIEPFCSFLISSSGSKAKYIEEASIDKLHEIVDELHFYNLERFSFLVDNKPVESESESESEYEDINWAPSGKAPGSNRPKPLVV